jgi:hypothetical protein
MRLDLVTHITGELVRAQQLEIEIGGMLIGALPGGNSQVLRVDDVAIITRPVEEGPIYMLDPERHLEFTEIIKEAAQRQNKVPVGFFRSHLRPSPLLPAIADKTLLAGQFPEGNYAFLLIQSREPRTAAFFLAVGGQLSEQPSVQKFLFDDTEFKRLPEIEVENTELEAAETKRRVPRPRAPDVPDDVSIGIVEQRSRWITIASLAALLLLLAFAIFSAPVKRSFRPNTNKLNLVATAKAGVLQITWDHGAPSIVTAKKALLVIDDGSSHRELMLAPDELKLGEVDYERSSGKVSIALTLDSPGFPLPPQTVDWSEN